jgi:ADP-ribose pyrophosphatase YjhB (NUDIX family)
MREGDIHQIEVHVSGYCFDGDKILVVKRTPERKIYPQLWETGGGQVRKEENFEEAVLRSMHDELGVEVELADIFSTYEISVPDLPQKKIPGLRFACRFKNYLDEQGPRISAEHSEWRWQPIEKLAKLDFISGVREDIAEAWKKLQKKPK